MRTDTNHKRQRGVSLVEILVVLMLVAMLAGVVVVSAPPGRSDAQKTAERLAAKLEFAAQEAITSGAIVGLEIDESRYEFYRYHRSEWKALVSTHLTGGGFPADLSVSVSREDAAKKNEPEERQKLNESETVIRPDLRFSPTGETTSLSVTLQDRRESWRVSLDDTGNVEVSDHASEG